MYSILPSRVPSTRPHTAGRGTGGGPTGSGESLELPTPHDDPHSTTLLTPVGWEEEKKSQHTRGMGERVVLHEVQVLSLLTCESVVSLSMHCPDVTFQNLTVLSELPPPVAKRFNCQGHQERA